MHPPHRLAAALLLLAAAARADVQPASVFTDHLVLQRDRPAPVWGKADAGEQVTVEFAGQRASATAGADGRWHVFLDPLPASAEPRRLVIAGRNRVVREDVLVGDVWLASGQSNMAYPLGRTSDGAAALAEPPDPLLRWLHVGCPVRAEPQESLTGEAVWMQVDARSRPSCSAVAYHFARAIRRSQHVPVGIIQAALGGTAAEQWVAQDALLARPELRALFAEEERKIAEWDSGETLARYEKKRARDATAKEAGAAAAKARGPPRDPRTLHHLSGLFNGRIAPLQPYALRGVLWYQGEQNGTRGAQYRVLLPTLIENWRATWARPAAWGTGAPARAAEDLPFLFVQLPNYTPTTARGTEWAEVRDAQLHTLRTVPRTGMAVTIDVGDPQDIHPLRKLPVGERLAQAARALVYGEPLPATGPLLDRVARDGDRLVLSFTERGGGLVSRTGDLLADFAVAGPDGAFVDAAARIDGDTVVVSAPGLDAPAAVRYAFANAPTASLFNREGLPASPFRATVPADAP